MNSNDPIYKALGLSRIDDEIEPVKQLPSLLPTGESSVESDFEFARENLGKLVEEGQDALTELIKFAKVSQQSRPYEVLAGLIKSLTDTNKAILELRQQQHDINNPKHGQSADTINNNLFVTNDIASMFPSAARDAILLKQKARDDKDALDGSVET